MAMQRKVDRRTFIGAAAGAAGATALGPALSLGHGNDDKGRHKGDRLVPRDRLGLQQFAIRDSITRLDKSVSGVLGGRRFPEDPADVGPAVMLPGGFTAVFEYLASVGYTGFEFFSFSNGANPAMTPAEIRTALDDAGLKAAGTHTGGLAAMTVPANLQAQIDMAGILGYRMVGTAGNPANPTLGTLDAWKPLRRAGQHGRGGVPGRGHQVLLPSRAGLVPVLRGPAAPRARSRAPDRLVHRQHGSPARALRARHDAHARRSRALPRSRRRPALRRQRLVRPARRPEAADRLAREGRGPHHPAARAGTNPFTQTMARPGFPITSGIPPAPIDVVYVGEGSIAKGYPVDPDPEVIGYSDQFDRFELSSPGWFHAESDSGPGPAATDPGRSLRWAKVSAKYLLNLRGDDDRDDCDDDDDHHGHGH